MSKNTKARFIRAYPLIKINKDNVFFLSPNPHGLSLKPCKFTKKNKQLSIEVRFKPEWDTIKPNQENAVVMFNGKHMGVSFAFDDEGQYWLKATTWTDTNPYQAFVKLADKPDIVHAKFLLRILENRNVLTLTAIKGADEGWDEGETILFKNGVADDYEFSYLWVGCSSALKSVPKELRWYGNFQIDFLKIMIDDEVVIEPDFSKFTSYKIFDKSYNGNHLMKHSLEWFDE